MKKPLKLTWMTYHISTNISSTSPQKSSSARSLVSSFAFSLSGVSTEMFWCSIRSFMLRRSSLSPESPEKAPCIEGAISATSVSRTFLSSEPTALTTRGAMAARIGVATFARSPVMFAAVKAENGRM